jgi:hypothetical protein
MVAVGRCGSDILLGFGWLLDAFFYRHRRFGESKGINHGDLPTAYKFDSEDLVSVDTKP